jgi:uncharacterized protein YecE (DUF72 family)
MTFRCILEAAITAARVHGMINNGVYTYSYFNNHFAGHAPESLETFRRLWSREEP